MRALLLREALVAAESSALLLSRPVSAARITGDGAAAFLHNMLTADVSSLAEYEVAHASLVDARGAMIDLLTLLRLGGRADDGDAGFLAIGSHEAPLAAMLDKFVFPADRVSVSDASDGLEWFEVVGPLARDVVSRSGCGALSPNRCAQIDEGTVAFGAGSLGYDAQSLLLRRGLQADKAAALRVGVLDAGGVAADKTPDAWELLRIARGRPARGFEYAVEWADAADAPRRLSPLELGLWDTVGLDKGCYMGQEVVSRLAKVARPRNELVGLDFGDSGVGTNSLGAAIAVEGGDTEADATVGTLTSCAGGVGLAIVNPRLVGPGSRVRVDGAPAVLRSLPFSSKRPESLEALTDPKAEAAAAADAEKRRAEAERKAAKLAAMKARVDAMQRAQRAANTEQ